MSFHLISNSILGYFSKANATISNFTSFNNILYADQDQDLVWIITIV